MGLLGSFTSAHHRSIITALVLLSVESNDLSTVSNQVAHRVQSIGLDNGGVASRSHNQTCHQQQDRSQLGWQSSGVAMGVL